MSFKLQLKMANGTSSYGYSKLRAQTKFVNSKVIRINCPCGNDLLNHMVETCAPTHRERVLKLINLVRNNDEIRENLTVMNRVNLSIDASTSFTKIPCCIWLTKLRRDCHFFTYDSYCIHCGIATDYRGPMENRHINIGEFVGYSCNRCHALITEKSRGELCIRTAQMIPICKAKKDRIRMTVGVCLSRTMWVKDLRKLLFSWFLKTCEECSC